MRKQRTYASKVSREWLKEIFDYVPSTGVFFWKTKVSKKVNVGSVAGAKSGNGYIFLTAHNITLLAHRAAWLFVYGEDPDGEIDHINGDRSDNRIDNLRVATSSDNGCNKKLLPSNKSGYRGVSWNKEKRKWQARIQKNRKVHILGYFDDIEKARMAYLEASVRIHGEFARPDG